MAEKSHEELAQLRAEVAALRDELAGLQQDLRVARAYVDLTMRGQLRCRACQCRRITHAPKVLDRAENDERKELALYRPSWWSGKVNGELEAYVCTQCGLVEWWVSDPSSLQPHDEYLHIIDGDVDAPKAPYR